MNSKIEELKKSSVKMNWGLRRCFMYEAEMETAIQLSYRHHLHQLILIQIIDDRIFLE